MVGGAIDDHVERRRSDRHARRDCGHRAAALADFTSQGRVVAEQRGDRATPAGVLAIPLRRGEAIEGKPVETFDGDEYVRETWLRADLAIVKAWKADPAGNLMFRKTARNFNPVMATAAKVTVAEVEEIVDAGALDPDAIHTPGIYVNRIVKSTINEKRIENRTVREREAT